MSFFDVWSEDGAVFERLMNIHSNPPILYTLFGHKDGSNIETYCIFFSLFITLEQLNDYVIILEYQGENNICKMLRYVTLPFVWSYGRPNVPYSVFFAAPIAYVQ